MEMARRRLKHLRFDDDEDISTFFRSLGMHHTQREAAIQACAEKYVLNVRDLRFIIEGGEEQLRELLPYQLGIRVRIKDWYDNHMMNDDDETNIHGQGQQHTRRPTPVPVPVPAQLENFEVIQQSQVRPPVSVPGIIVQPEYAEHVAHINSNNVEAAPNQNKQSLMSIVVKNLNGLSRYFDVTPNMTVSQLKEMYMRLEGYGTCEFIHDRTKKQFKVLDRNLADYNVAHGTILHFMLPFKSKTYYDL